MTSTFIIIVRQFQVLTSQFCGEHAVAIDGRSLGKQQQQTFIFYFSIVLGHCSTNDFILNNADDYFLSNAIL